MFTAFLLAGSLVNFSLSAVAQNGMVDDLKATSHSVEQLSARLTPAVVEIDVRGWSVDNSAENPQHAGFLVSDHTIGSGSLISSDGEIVTNHHVIRGAQHISVQLAGSSKIYDARLIGDDPEDDLALLRIQESGLPHFTLEADQKVTQGQFVLALGNPYGFAHSVTMGIVSAPSREVDEDAPTNYIQTDAPINPGNSGGPLVDLDGHLVGINSLIYTSSGGNEGVAFAIPVDTVARVVSAMEKYGVVKRPYLGLSLQLVTESLARGLNLMTTAGVLVNDVDDTSPAESAGIQPGDVILSIQGKSITDWKSFQDVLNALTPGEGVRLTIERSRARSAISLQPRYGAPRHLELIDYANVSRDTVNQLGIVGVSLDPAVRSLLASTRLADGVVVAAKCDALAYDSDLLDVGDILHQINGEAIHDIGDLHTSLEKAVPGQPLILQIERKGHLMFVVVASQV